MSVQTDRFTAALSDLGLTKDEATIYLYLVHNGVQTALSISRGIRMGRTKVYRVLNRLVEQGIVQQVLKGKGTTFQVADVHALEMLLSQREQEFHSIEASLPVLMTQLSAKMGESVSDTKVLHFEGEEGLAQVTWNSLKADGLLRIYEVESSMSSFLEEGFSEKVREEIVERGIHVRQLTNLRHIPAYTKVSRLVQEFWEVKHINKKDLPLIFEILVYNDVVALYSFKQKKPFCVEVHNADFARMQEGLFDYVWNQAESMKVINDEGEAVLV